MVPSPCCGERLRVIGSRQRKALDETGESRVFCIRRMRCDSCRRIHHELPDCLVPYKRYEASCVERVIAAETDVLEIAADNSTLCRWQSWMKELITYLLGCLTSITIRFHLDPVEPSSDASQPAHHRLGRYVGNAAGWMARTVRSVANSNLWPIQALSINVAIVTLFVFAPLFGIPVRTPENFLALKNLYRTSVSGKSSFFAGTQLLVHILGIFLNVGSITVVYHLASAHPMSEAKRLLENALNRGFAATIFWSPYFAAMAMVTSSLSLEWIKLLPYLLGMAFLSFVLSFVVELPHLRTLSSTDDKVSPTNIRPEKSNIKALLPLCCYLICAMVIILVLERTLPLPMVMITCLSALLYPFLWSLFSRSLRSYIQGTKDHAVKTLPALKKEITLFLAAGFFSGAAAETPFGEWVIRIIAEVPLPLPLAFTICTVLLISGTSLIGLHPIILATILATTIDPADVGLTPQFFGMLLLGTWAVSNTISPATAVNNLIASMTNTDVLKIASRNYKFAAISLVVIPAYLFLLKI